MAEPGQLLPADALNKRAPQPIPPLAGFWFRLGALVLDVFLVRMALQLSYPPLRPLYLQMGAASALVGLAVAWLYFFLAEGPVGKGMTVGKALLGIRTTTLEGEQTPPGAAALRALLIVLLILFFLLVLLPLAGINVGARLPFSGSRTAELVALALFNGLAMPYVIGNLFLAILHPLKQTMHDLLARTIVLREAGAHNLAAYRQQAAERVHPLQRHAIPLALIAFLAMGGINLFAVCREAFSNEGRESLRFLRTFDQEFRRGSFQPAYIQGQWGMVERFLAADGVSTRAMAAQLPPAPPGEPAPTSQTFVVILLFQSHARTASDDLGTTDQLTALGHRSASWLQDQIHENAFPFDRKSRTGKQLLFQPRYLAMIFIQEVNLTLFADMRLLWSKIVPLTLPKGFYEEERALAGKERDKAASPGAASTTPTTATRPTDRPTTGGT